MSRLRSEAIQLKYGGSSEVIVDDLSIEIRDGLITTIIDPNGCGKSTLLRALGRLMEPARGTVVLDGEAIHRQPAKDVARRLGLLHQQTQAPEGITVEDLARHGRYPHQGFLQPPTRRDLDAVEHALDLAGVTALRNRPLDSLSGGQRQRARIAMLKGSALAPYRLRLSDDLYQQLIAEYQQEVVNHCGTSAPYFLPFNRILIWAQYRSRLAVDGGGRDSG